jgi:hypothetical protein
MNMWKRMSRYIDIDKDINATLCETTIKVSALADSYRKEARTTISRSRGGLSGFSAV